ncbi:radical SAM protein [Arcobacter sp. LA11]|uniref:radical SAM protein n=1 Tax=Arcobacter sp. LA11 TaxID=1898176 RepID=UPI0009334799|nr:radical SAM protein [Arcobacter sp. LA11]
MIDYHQPVFRPPAEANSIIIQVALGCSFNKCSFCSMYETKKFKVRALEDIFDDIKTLSIYDDTRRVFLADGDALACDTDFLVKVLNYLKECFPKLQRVSSYASPYNLLEKSLDDLKILRKHGLSLVYYGMESGNHELLKYINKPMHPLKIVEGLDKASDANMKTSVTVILGLGGKNLTKQHIEDSAKIVNECKHINYLSTLQLGLSDTKEDNFFQRFEKKNQEFIFCSDEEMLDEQRRFISLINPKKSIIFRSNHASNALPLKGTLPKDKDELLSVLNMALEDDSLLRPSFLRGF